MGEHIRELRLHLGWSQKTLADHADLEQNQIQRVENAKNTPTLALITAISKALGKQPYELLKVSHQVKVNKHLGPPDKKRLTTTKYVRAVVSTPFLNTPRSVVEVVKFCEERFGVVVASSATSAILKKMMTEKLIRRVPAKIRGRYLYQLVPK